MPLPRRIAIADPAWYGTLTTTLGSWKLPQDLFCALFETETATEMLQADLPKQLQELGFGSIKQELFAAGALQRITAQSPNKNFAPIPPKN